MGPGLRHLLEPSLDLSVEADGIGILRDAGVMREKRHALGDGLRNKKTVERVAVVLGEGRQGEDVAAFDGKLEIAGLEKAGADQSRLRLKVRPVKRPLDRDLPNGNDGEVERVGRVSDQLGDRFWKPWAPPGRPEDKLRVWQKVHSSP